MADGVDDHAGRRRACGSRCARAINIHRWNARSHRNGMEEVLRRAVDRKARDAACRGVVRASAVSKHCGNVNRGAVRLRVRRPTDHAEAWSGRIVRAVERRQAHQTRLVAKVRRNQERLPGRRRDRGSRDGGVVGTAACGDEASRQVTWLVRGNDDVGRHIGPLVECSDEVVSDKAHARSNGR